MLSKLVKGSSGFGWDSTRQTLTAPDSVWNSVSKSTQKYKDYTFAYYDLMDRIFG